jgi:cytochrome c oxidase cbb3-type subunit 1
LEIVKNTMPWLKARSVSGFLLLIAHSAFAVNFFWMLFAAGNFKISATPTLLNPKEEGAV